MSTPPTDPPGAGEPITKRVTLRTLRRWALAGEPFACLTAYDATSARWLARAGVPVLLMGDSAAEVILGFDRTIDMPLDVSIALTAAVRRGAPLAFVMADMPFMSYQASPDDALVSAARFLVEGLADCVKLEADASYAPLVQRMTRAGIPVCAHVGSRPSTAALAGGYGSAGRNARDAEQIVADAIALERAGAVLLLIEAVPPEVTERVLRETRTPLIGIGAGPACHGQILVLQDLLGMTDAPPRFAQRSAALGIEIQKAAADWAHRVAHRDIGGQGYTMHDGEADRFYSS